jgi:hypothetical protein
MSEGTEGLDQMLTAFEPGPRATLLRVLEAEERSAQR